MNSVQDIPWLVLVGFMALLLVPIWLNSRLQLGIGKDVLVGVTRMTLQLILVGVYLEYLFSLNSLTVSALWLLAMVLIGASSILSKSRLPQGQLLTLVSSGLICALFPLLFIICLLVVQPVPFYHPQYLIPLAGMLLGNSLSGNIIALQNLFSAFEQRRDEYEAAISLGAKPSYACKPFVQEAMQKSLAPTLASMTTMGLVTLPGMMTGQILGGASPIIAIKYQLMIMVAIFVMLTVSVGITLSLVIKTQIDPNGRLLVKQKSP
ncbi:ABC transporter permease [Vibrio sonorensis]|uniref:ABC transporter permease n=1 Tax=Vibrio sonorensis TaxID=1004316 RepID=UPI0008DA1BC2|nr:ABC transporter permease [Vibrio sonorensis]